MPFLTVPLLMQAVPNLPQKRAEEVLPHLERAIVEAGATTKARAAAFIAQVGHESGSFRYNEELASGDAYEGRKDLGNTQPGDGRRFKGRGYIQVTGRENYTKAGQALGLPLVQQPELAALPENAARIAAWYWRTRGLNELADAGKFDAITKRINGGFNGKADRDTRFAKALAVVGENAGSLGLGTVLLAGLGFFLWRRYRRW